MLNHALGRSCTLLAILLSGTSSLADEQIAVGSIPIELQKRFELHPFYEQYVDAGGLPILASAKVEPAALLEARRLILSMLAGAPKLLTAMAKAHVRVTVMAVNEMTTDVPEYSRLKPAAYWDRRARGLGGTRRNAVTSCGEENLLRLEGDPYWDENILIHEFAHTVHLVGMSQLDKTFDARLRDAFAVAQEKGLWANTYAMTDPKEYFAEGTQTWFECNARPGPIHSEIRTREGLKRYDAELAKLLGEVYGANPWKYPQQAKPKSNQENPATSTKQFKWPAHYSE